jgi:hypothetical protein
MSRKQLIQCVATVFGVVLLYVASMAPLFVLLGPSDSCDGETRKRKTEEFNAYYYPVIEAQKSAPWGRRH